MRIAWIWNGTRTCLRLASAAARTLPALSAREIGIAIEALVTLLSVGVSFRLKREMTLARVLAEPSRRRVQLVPLDDRAAILRLTAAVARHFPLPTHCLGRSLSVSRMLQRRGVDARVVVGVRLEAGAIFAHAWVESEGLPLAESPNVGLHFARVDPHVLDAYGSNDGITWWRA